MAPRKQLLKGAQNPVQPSPVRAGFVPGFPSLGWRGLGRRQKKVMKELLKARTFHPRVKYLASPLPFAEGAGFFPAYSLLLRKLKVCRPSALKKSGNKLRNNSNHFRPLSVLCPPGLGGACAWGVCVKVYETEFLAFAAPAAAPLPRPPFFRGLHLAWESLSVRRTVTGALRWSGLTGVI